MSGQGTRIHVRFPAELWEKILAEVRRTGATPAEVVIAAMIRQMGAKPPRPEA